jgi:dCMP deaminase
MTRPDWDEYFMAIARAVSTRATCRGIAVGAVITRDNRILSTGYNGPPAGFPNCIDQGCCYGGVDNCTQSSAPSRAVHAEANAIAYAARFGIATDGATIYVTSEPCVACLKLILSAGIVRVVYADPWEGNRDNPVACELLTNLKVRQLLP